MRMESCTKCGGAKFYGSGAVGWGGPICNCREPVFQNPPSIPQQGAVITFSHSSDPALLRIESKLEVLIELFKVKEIK